MSDFRTFRPQPSRRFKLATWGWFGLVALFCLINAWLPLGAVRPVGQGLWLVGLLLAITHILVALGAVAPRIFLRGLAVAGVGLLTVGPEWNAPTIGAAVRLAHAEGHYREALAAYDLTGEAVCDCLITHRAGNRVIAFRWRRGAAVWDAIVHDPARAADPAKQDSDEKRGGKSASPLGGPLLVYRPVRGAWVYVVVRRVEG